MYTPHERPEPVWRIHAQILHSLTRGARLKRGASITGAATRTFLGATAVGAAADTAEGTVALGTDADLAALPQSVLGTVHGAAVCLLLAEPARAAASQLLISSTARKRAILIDVVDSEQCAHAAATINGCLQQFCWIGRENACTYWAGLAETTTRTNAAAQRHPK